MPSTTPCTCNYLNINHGFSVTDLLQSIKSMFKVEDNSQGHDIHNFTVTFHAKRITMTSDGTPHNYEGKCHRNSSCFALPFNNCVVKDFK